MPEHNDEVHKSTEEAKSKFIEQLEAGDGIADMTLLSSANLSYDFSHIVYITLHRSLVPYGEDIVRCVKLLREEFYSDRGILLPSIRIQDDPDLGPRAAHLLIHDETVSAQKFPEDMENSCLFIYKDLSTEWLCADDADSKQAQGEGMAHPSVVLSFVRILAGQALIKHLDKLFVFENSLQLLEQLAEKQPLTVDYLRQHHLEFTFHTALKKQVVSQGNIGNLISLIEKLIEPH